MPRKKIKPELTPEILGISPFMEGLQIAVTKRAMKVINKFGNEDERVYELEATAYTKVFEVESARVQVSELPLRCKEMYLYLIHAVKSAQDYVWIERAAYMDLMGIKSVNTFKSTVAELSKSAYICPHVTIKDVYWINPYYFFKGSRLNKYKDHLVEKK